MQPSQSSSSGDGRLPVFVFPNALTFYADDQASFKQVLTLYNPYDFAVRFKVLCTAPRKYVVVDAEGTIKARCCIDIVIRHNAISPTNYGAVDKFRLQVQEHGQKQLLGKKDVTATLLPNRPDSGSGICGSATAEQDQFQQLLPSSIPGVRGQQYSIVGTRQVRGSTSPNVFVVLAAIVCIVALMLPTEGQTDSQLPTYLHLSLHQKLIFAYTLGLVTMVILRT